ncbi:MAG TPA: hypothetical protein VN740_04190 [Solirubrobacteraceae bacterium]|nr:hypothetical protein [Solirubrobacteraceae bacterium]
MRPRDRLVLALIATVLVAGAMWVILVSPERSQVNSLSTQIAAEQTALTGAQTQLTAARDAVAAYVGHIHQIDEVMRAVPTSPGEAALIKTIVKLAGTSVDFHELDVGTSNPSSAGPMAMGLTFTFNANYGNLQSFLSAIDALTSTDGTQVSSSGRLFTIQTVSLTPASSGSTKATIVASVYQQAPTAVATGATGATGVTTP